MQIHNPVPPTELSENRRAPRVAIGSRPRVLIVNNARPGGQSILESLLMSLRETGLYESVETHLLPSGSSFEQVADTARHFDAVVVGIGD